MPQSGRVSVTVKSLQQNYKERYTAKRKRPRYLSESAAAPLPYSPEVVADLNSSLAEQPASKAALLEQPACLASPVVPPPVM